MRNFMIAAFAAFGFSGAAPAADSYTLDPNHTFPRFEINHFGFSTHHGQFNETAVRFNGDTPASAEGELTLLGVTRPLTLTISRVVCAPHPFYKKEDCGAEVTGTLKRSEFGMKACLPAVGDEVTLRIQVEALKD